MSVAPEKELLRMIERFETVVDKEAQRLIDFALKQNLNLDVYVLGEWFHMEDKQLVCN